MASRKTIIIKICLFLHILEVLLGSVLSVFSFLLQNAAIVGLDETPSWLGVPCAVFGLVGIVIIVLNKLKEELVFVLVFHILLIGLCIISLILVAPKVSKWHQVSTYHSSGSCIQIDKTCNCTQALPTKVFKCVDLVGIYDLAVIIAVVVGLCLANAVLAAYFDCLILIRYIPQDTSFETSTSRRKNPYDDEQIGNSFGEIGHVGPLNTPELAPKFRDDLLNPILLNRSEQETKLHEEEAETTGDQMGSSASLPAEKPAVQHKSVAPTEKARVSSMPNSVSGSKQSIRSRKDNLLRRLHEVQSKSLDESYRNEDANDDAILTEIERSSRSSSKINVNETGSPVRTSPRIGDTSDFVARSVNRGVSKEDLSPLEKVSPQVLSQQSADKNSSHRNGVDYSQRSYSETNIGENSTRKGTYSGIDKSERSHSEGDVLEISNNDNNLTNHAMITRVPGKIEERLTKSSSNFDRTDFNEKSPLQQDFQAEVYKNNPPASGRRSGYANRMLHGLPPLPLKDFQHDLTVQERTFSAPTLPFIESVSNHVARDESMRRPESSGSQHLATSKKEFPVRVRNGLIDTDNLTDQNLVPSEEELDAISEADNGRKNSFDTNSTDIEIDDKVEGSETSEDLGKKPRWHPPWQLKQEILAHKDSIPVLVIEPRNRWFASGSADRSMKIWDINSGNCRLTVKAHKARLRALAFGSTGHRFIFSAADDRQLICTDIEVNKVVSHYPDQSSVIYAMAMYRPAELLVTCGRDKYVKIWDTREKKCVKTMRGHMNTTSSIAIIQNSGQIVSGSHDSTMRIWDIGEGRCTQILTGHDKSIRSIVVHPEEPVISSASTERIIHWSMPDGERIKEITPTDISINCISVNPQGALVAAGSNGVIHLWDWKSGHKFQKIHRTSVYESQEVPICVFSVAFDKSGSRLFVSDASNIIKVYGEAYTRVRRRHAGSEEKSQNKDRQSKFTTPDYAFI